MLTLARMQKILLEKNREKQRQMIDALPADEKEKLLAEAEKTNRSWKRTD